MNRFPIVYHGVRIKQFSTIAEALQSCKLFFTFGELNNSVIESFVLQFRPNTWFCPLVCNQVYKIINLQTVICFKIFQSDLKILRIEIQSLKCQCVSAVWKILKYCRDFDFQYNTSKCCYYYHISLPAKQSSTVTMWPFPASPLCHYRYLYCAEKSFHSSRYPPRYSSGLLRIYICTNSIWFFTPKWYTS